MHVLVSSEYNGNYWLKRSLFITCAKQLINMLCKYSYGYVGIYVEIDYFMVKL